MKIDRIGLECVENKFLKLPNIQKYEVVHRTEDGFIASVEMDDGYEFHIDACFLNRVFPSIIIKLIVDCQHFFRQIFLGYFPDIVQAFDTLGRNVYGDDYTSLHNPIVLSSVLLVYGMFHSTQILF